MDTKNGSGPQLTCTVDNRGKSEARNIRITLSGDIVELNGGLVSSFSGSRAIPYVMPETVDGNISIDLNGFKFGNEDTDAVKRQRLRIVLVATIEFVDTFKKARTDGPVRYCGAPELFEPWITEGHTRINISLGREP